MATADEIAEAYADWQVRCNGNTRLARMLRGWDRTVHLVGHATPATGSPSTVSGTVLADLRHGLVGRPDLVVSATSEDFADLFWGDLNPSEKYLSGRDRPGRVVRGRDASRRHVHGRLPRPVTRHPLAGPGADRAAAAGPGPPPCVGPCSLRTAVSTSTGLAFAALQYLAAAGLVAYVAGDSAWISIAVAGLLALLAWGFFGELNGMFPTAAAIRRYMSGAMDDRVALTITFTYLSTIVLVVAADAFIVSAALTHVLHAPGWLTAVVDPGPARRRRPVQPPRRQGGRLGPGRGHLDRPGGHAGRLRRGPGPFGHGTADAPPAAAPPLGRDSSSRWRSGSSSTAPSSG